MEVGNIANLECRILGNGCGIATFFQSIVLLILALFILAESVKQISFVRPGILQLREETTDLPHTIDDGWTDTKESVASQGKLWVPKHFRTYPHKESSITSHGNFCQPFGEVHGPICEKWAVVTTIFHPTLLINQISNLSTWCLVVVGDRKTEDEIWRKYTENISHKVVYLSSRDQEALPYTFVKRLPWNNFGRKNVGYMFAIHHGAKMIWDTDDDNELKDPSFLDVLAEKASKTSVKINETTYDHHLWNPYPTFLKNGFRSGKPKNSIWPRGFPLPFIKESKTFSGNKLTESENVGIFQSLADNDPDVDAIYRLSQPLPVFFKAMSNSPKFIALPQGRVAPFNAQATLWFQSSFWSLMLPITVHGRVSDIWRSYIAQRMMHQVGQRLAFTSPIVTQIRNVHSYIADLQAEIPLYTKTHELVKWIYDWKPPHEAQNHPLVAAMEDLYINLYEIGIVEIEDVSLIQDWMSDLCTLKYDFPKLTTWDDFQFFPVKQR